MKNKEGREVGKYEVFRKDRFLGGYFFSCLPFLEVFTVFNNINNFLVGFLSSINSFIFFLQLSHALRIYVDRWIYL